MAATWEIWDSHYAKWPYIPNILQMCAKENQLQVFTLHAIAMCGPAIKIPLKCNVHATYVNYFMCRCETSMSVYIPHMNWLKSILWPEVLVYIHFTILPYAPEQICLPIAHVCPTACLLYFTCRPNMTTHISKITKCIFNLWCYCSICASNKSAPEITYIYHKSKLLNVHHGMEVC